MKKIALVLIAIALISSVAMAGDMAKSGQWGVQTSLGAGSNNTATIGLKFMASENLAIRVEAGFGSVSPANGSGSTSDYGFGAGFEYHMTALGSVSPYVGIGAGYSGVSVSNQPAGQSNPAYFNVQGYWGGEYFFSSNFSWAGQIGIGYTGHTNQAYQDPNDATKTLYGTDNTIGTTSATMILTWYLN